MIIKAQQIAKAGQRQCFSADTLVFTAEGLKKIQDVNVGDLVWSYSEETSKPVLQKVRRLFRDIADKWLNIIINDEVIECTYEHPFYIADKGWVYAIDLVVGDKLVDINGSILSIDDIKLVNKVKIIYNFEVDIAHNYYVGNNKILVHNDCTQRLKALQFVQEYMMNNGGSNSLWKKLEGLASDAKIGMRGSLVTDIKHSTGGPWDSSDFDLDIFIQSDELYNNSDLVTKNRSGAWLDLDKALESGGAAAAIVKELKEQAPGLFGGLKNGSKGISIKVFKNNYKKSGKVQMFNELR